MVVILCALISIIALIIGCLLTQVEQDNPSSAFSSVPAATYWISARMISMKDAQMEAGVVETIWGISLLGVTLVLKGVLWIVPIARIKQIFSLEYDAVMKLGSMKRSMVDNLFEAYKDGADFDASCTCRVELMGLDAKAIVPIPIFEAQDIDIVRTVEVPSGGKMEVRISWQPSKNDDDEVPEFPKGTLSLRTLGAKGLSNAAMGVIFEVPTGAYKKTSQTAAWRASNFGEGETCTFSIDWTNSFQAGAVATEQDYHHEDGEDPGFHHKVMELLFHQSAMLRKQAEKLDTIEKRQLEMEKRQVGQASSNR